MPSELDQARHAAAIQLLQLIDDVTTIIDPYEHTTSALEVVDRIAHYTWIKCSLPPQTS